MREKTNKQTYRQMRLTGERYHKKLIQKQRKQRKKDLTCEPNKGRRDQFSRARAKNLGEVSCTHMGGRQGDKHQRYQLGKQTTVEKQFHHVSRVHPSKAVGHD